MTFAALQEQLSEHIYHFNHGNHEAAYQFLGCHKVDRVIASPFGPLMQPMSTFKVISITGRMSHSAI